ncbi:MAG: hypothetical protein HZB47_15410 [Nitrosomonadales bacterium]|nr:hypothetical protein [Nitrosomonadales bacterium]
MKYYFGLLLLLLTAPTHAGSMYDIYTVVGFQCNQAKDILLLTYQGASGSAGESLVRGMKPDQWDLWSLYYGRNTIRKQCSLSDGKYELTLSLYRSGSCDICYGIWAKVTHDGRLEFSEGLDGFEGPPTQTVITRAVIKSHDLSPELTKLSWDDFIERVHLAE